jgi:hypothetical protein
LVVPQSATMQAIAAVTSSFLDPIADEWRSSAGLGVYWFCRNSACEGPRARKASNESPSAKSHFAFGIEIPCQILDFGIGCRCQACRQLKTDQVESFSWAPPHLFWRRLVCDHCPLASSRALGFSALQILRRARGKTTSNKIHFRMRDHTPILQVTHNSLLRAAPKAAREC